MRTLILLATLLLTTAVGCSNSTPQQPTGPRPLEGHRIPGRPGTPPNPPKAQ